MRITAWLYNCQDIRLLGAAVSPGAAAERLAQLSQRARELARDDPDLVRVALRDLRQHLEVLVGEQLRVGVALVDRLEDRRDRPRLALRVERLRLLLALRAEDR